MAASWPTSVATDATLYTAVNSLETTLATTINSAVTTITLASTSGFPTAGAVTIDSEVVFYTGISGASLTGCTRGADGTAAATHTAGVAVGATIVAFHHNGLMAEIEAIEQNLSDRIGFGSAQLLAQDGSPSSPSYSFASDPLSGFTFLGTADWAAYANATLALRITEFGIGVGPLGFTSSAGFVLDARNDTAGQLTVVRILNNDNTNVASHAALEIGTNSAGGDPFLNFLTQDPSDVGFGMGLDNSTGAFKIYTGAFSSPTAPSDAVTVPIEIADTKITIDRRLLIPDGSPSLPAIAFTSELNSGFSWINTRDWAAYTNGIQSIRMSQYGVGVGPLGFTNSAGFVLDARDDTAGQLTVVRILNNDNTNAASHSALEIGTNSSGGDPFLNFLTQDPTDTGFGIGFDNSAGVFKIYTGSFSSPTSPSAATTVPIAISSTAITADLPLSMNSHKITNLANGSSSSDAAAFGQIPTTVEWTSYSPTFNGLGTPTSVTAYYKRLGNTLHIWGQFVLGTTTASEARIGLPGGYTTNSNIPTSPTNQLFGIANYVANQVTQYYITAKPSVTYVNIVAADSTHNTGNLLNGNTLFSSGNNFVFHADIPL